MIVRALNSYIPSDIESIKNLCPSFENLKVNNPQYEQRFKFAMSSFGRSYGPKFTDIFKYFCMDWANSFEESPNDLVEVDSYFENKFKEWSK